MARFSLPGRWAAIEYGPILLYCRSPVLARQRSFLAPAKKGLVIEVLQARFAHVEFFVFSPQADILRDLEDR